MTCAGCSPLGEPVDADVSSNYYHAKLGDGVTFCVQGNWAKLGHHKLEGVDTSTFRALASSIGADSEHVYYRQHQQPQIDRASFTVDGPLWRDATHIYYAKAGEERLASVSGADVDSFRYLFPETVNPRMWARDANRYYLDHQPIDVDAESFRFLNKGFAADREQIYRNQQGLTLVADVSGPISVINDYHLRMGTKVISGGSWAHRILTFDTIEEIRSISGQLVVTNGQLYDKGRLIEGWDGDLSSLEAWPQNETYLRDASHVYTLRPNLQRIEEADRASFAPAEDYGAYATDAQRVYYQGRVLSDADRDSFEIAVDSDGPYARDKHGRFFMGRRE
jgi:hypothetical protein